MCAARSGPGGFQALPPGHVRLQSGSHVFGRLLPVGRRWCPGPRHGDFGEIQSGVHVEVHLLVRSHVGPEGRGPAAPVNTDQKLGPFGSPRASWNIRVFTWTWSD